jgi:pimeloyl-ACP methyl ester carboxylesterase
MSGARTRGLSGSGTRGLSGSGRRRLKGQLRSLVAVAVLAVLAAACSASGGQKSAGAGGTAAGSTTPTTAQKVTATAPLRWSACAASAGPKGYQCATLQVPINYSDPSAGTIGLALDRHQATGTVEGSLLEDPGGPGVSGVDFLSTLVGEMPATMVEHFNIVGFDPRGVGQSDPVTCGTGSQLDSELSVDPSPTTSAGWNALVAADHSFVDGCQQRSGKLLRYVGTVNAARDMDRIRAALGESKLNYLGFSYGTYLGAVYAQLFPSRVRAMVLDGALDPALSQVATVTAQSAALDKELVAFLAECSDGQCGWDPSGGPAAAFNTLLARVTAHPVSVSGSTQKVGPAALLYGTAAALYSTASWPELGQSLAALASGNGDPMLELFNDYMGRASNGTYSNVVEAESAIDCASYPVPGLSAIKADGSAISKAAPVFGLLDLDSLATCAVWPFKPDLRPAPIHADGTPPIVVVGSTGDPITPYAWAKALASQLQHGVLLTRTGYGHTAYGASSCIRTDVDNYFLHLQVPAKGTTCPSD